MHKFDKKTKSTSRLRNSFYPRNKMVCVSSETYLPWGINN